MLNVFEGFSSACGDEDEGDRMSTKRNRFQLENLAR